MSMAELENVLLEAFEEPQQSEERERFRLTDENMANWALRKVAKARAEYEEAAKVAEAEVKRIDDWLNSRKRRFDTEPCADARRGKTPDTCPIASDPRRCNGGQGEACEDDPFHGTALRISLF